MPGCWIFSWRHRGPGWTLLSGSEATPHAEAPEQVEGCLMVWPAVPGGLKGTLSLTEEGKGM